MNNNSPLLTDEINAKVEALDNEYATILLSNENWEELIAKEVIAEEFSRLYPKAVRDNSLTPLVDVLSIKHSMHSLGSSEDYLDSSLGKLSTNEKDVDNFEQSELSTSLFVGSENTAENYKNSVEAVNNGTNLTIFDNSGYNIRTSEGVYGASTSDEETELFLTGSTYYSIATEDIEAVSFEEVISDRYYLDLAGYIEVINDSNKEVNAGYSEGESFENTPEVSEFIFSQSYYSYGVDTIYTIEGTDETEFDESVATYEDSDDEYNFTETSEETDEEDDYNYSESEDEEDDYSYSESEDEEDDYSYSESEDEEDDYNYSESEDDATEEEDWKDADQEDDDWEESDNSEQQEILHLSNIYYSALKRQITVKKKEINKESEINPDDDLDDDLFRGIDVTTSIGRLGNEPVKEVYKPVVEESQTKTTQNSRPDGVPEGYGSIDDEPKDIKSFVKKHKGTTIEIASKYFSTKDIKNALFVGKIFKKGDKLF